MLRSDHAVARWVAEATGYENYPDFEIAGCLGVEYRGQLGAAVLFNGYMPGVSMQIHLRVDNPRAIQRAFLHEVFRKAFRDFDIQFLMATISTANSACQRVAVHAGFGLYARMWGAFPDGDGLVFCLPKEACKYIGGNDAADER